MFKTGDKFVVEIDLAFEDGCGAPLYTLKNMESVSKINNSPAFDERVLAQLRPIRELSAPHTVTDWNALIEKASAEHVEITVTHSPEGEEIRIAPWEPFRYVCPNATR